MAERPLPFTVEELTEEMLTGIPLTFTDRNGNEVTYSDRTIERRIRAAVNTMERQLQVDLWPRKVITRAHSLYPDLVQGVDYDIDEDPLDYSSADVFAQGYIKLRRWPITAVESVEFRFPETTVLHAFPQEWLRVYHQTGQVHLVAIAGAAQPVIVSRAGGFFPLMTASLQRSGVPQLVYVKYTSGIDWTNESASVGAPLGRENYEDLRLAMMQQATIGVLFDLSRGIAPGVSSESLSEDGQSESVSYARGKGGVYGQEIEGLKDEVAQFVADFKRYRKGIRMSVL